MQLDKEDVIRLFTGVGDPMRLEIIFLLSEHDRLNVGEIAANFHLSRPAISHHLKVLKDARVLKSEKSAQEVYYWLDGERAAVQAKQDPSSQRRNEWLRTSNPRCWSQ